MKHPNKKSQRKRMRRKKKRKESSSSLTTLKADWKLERPLSRESLRR